jgi:hypothetical protein
MLSALDAAAGGGIFIDHGAAGDKEEDQKKVRSRTAGMKKVRSRTAGMWSRNDGVVMLRMIIMRMRDDKAYKYNKDVAGSCGMWVNRMRVDDGW